MGPRLAGAAWKKRLGGRRNRAPRGVVRHSGGLRLGPGPPSQVHQVHRLALPGLSHVPVSRPATPSASCFVTLAGRGVTASRENTARARLRHHVQMARCSPSQEQGVRAEAPTPDTRPWAAPVSGRGDAPTRELELVSKAMTFPLKHTSLDHRLLCATLIESGAFSF